MGLSTGFVTATATNVILEQLGITKRIEEDESKDVVVKEIYNKTMIAPKNDICGGT